MTLLELIAATTIMATIMASTVVLVRSSYSVWQATEGDMERADGACAAIRHIVRNVRQATAVTAISSAGNSSGNLSLLMASGETRLWDHSSGTSQVLYGVAPSSADQLLVDNINELTFVGYEADGVTTTTIVANIRAIHCTAQVTMPAGGGTTRTVSCWAWIRSW